MIYEHKGCSRTVHDISSCFTNIFALIKRYEIYPGGFSIFAYNIDELNMLYIDLENAFTIMSKNLQNISRLVISAEKSKSRSCAEYKDVCDFMACIANLIEALRLLKVDTEFALLQQHD